LRRKGAVLRTKSGSRRANLGQSYPQLLPNGAKPLDVAKKDIIKI
jgi:hypothetical protein